MPYFVKVGYERKNVHLVTSKGYFIKRSRNSISTKWGAIDVIGLKRKKFTWHLSIGTKTYLFRSINKALEFKKERMELIRRKEYNKLPPNSIIYTRKFY